MCIRTPTDGRGEPFCRSTPDRQVDVLHLPNAVRVNFKKIVDDGVSTMKEEYIVRQR